ncbi:hypothetical protein PUN28_002924 [Cardiocondyla obscurior]|uniref:Uncharacterized protein n=1 Tax=Cardiocondyla obscurior TaxID=286306 RepID=A0AAW2GWX4_9HYME
MQIAVQVVTSRVIALKSRFDLTHRTSAWQSGKYRGPRSFSRPPLCPVSIYESPNCLCKFTHVTTVILIALVAAKFQYLDQLHLRHCSRAIRSLWENSPFYENNSLLSDSKKRKRNLKMFSTFKYSIAKHFKIFEITLIFFIKFI